MGVRRKLNNWLRKYFLENIIGPEEIVQMAEEIRIRKNSALLVMGEGARLYGDAEVFNLQRDKEKIRIGKNTHIRGHLLVFAHGGEIRIGENCYLGSDSRIWSGEQVHIGNNVLISHNVNIVDTNSHEIDPIERANGFVSLMKNGYSKEKGSIQTSPVTIGDYAWISFNCSILKGVTIGKGAIIAAGSVVTKDVPPFVVVAGNPAVVVKQLEEFV